MNYIQLRKLRKNAFEAICADMKMIDENPVQGHAFHAQLMRKLEFHRACDTEIDAVLDDSSETDLGHAAGQALEELESYINNNTCPHALIRNAADILRDALTIYVES